MAFTKPVQQYVRSPQPTLPDSQIKYLQGELRKIEESLRSLRELLIELEARVAALETP